MENLDTERLMSSEMTFLPVEGASTHGAARVVNFKTGMKPVSTNRLLLLTYTTLQTIMNNHPKVLELNKRLDSMQVVQNVWNFLSSKTERGGPSWKDQFIRFLNVPAALALEDMKLSEWLALTHSFSVLVPLTDAEDIARYLTRLEEDVPIESKDSKRQGNGCTIHWIKVSDEGIYYCLCVDHVLYGICLLSTHSPVAGHQGHHHDSVKVELCAH